MAAAIAGDTDKNAVMDAERNVAAVAIKVAAEARSFASEAALAARLSAERAHDAGLAALAAVPTGATGVAGVAAASVAGGEAPGPGEHSGDRSEQPKEEL